MLIILILFLERDLIKIEINGYGVCAGLSGVEFPFIIFVLLSLL